MMAPTKGEYQSAAYSLHYPMPPKIAMWFNPSCFVSEAKDLVNATNGLHDMKERVKLCLAPEFLV